MKTGEEIYLLFGQYGPYVQRGKVSEDVPKPKRASLPNGVKPEDLSLDDAIGLLKLPRLLGEHGDGGKIQAGLGRFGPYVVWNKGKGEKDYRSLKGEDDVLTVDLARALELLAMPKRGRGGRTALKVLGIPEGSEENIQVYDGPYGLYVKQGKINASLPEGKGAEDITLEEAIELLAAKSASKKSTRRSAATKKTATKKPATKKTATKKKTESKTSAKAPAKPSLDRTRATTKSGRLRASAVKVIRPGNG